MRRLLQIGMLSIPLLAQDAILEHARQVNLERAAHMPNFVADEILTFGLDRKGSGEWEHLPQLFEDEITVNANRISRQDFRRNEKPWHPPLIARMRGFTPGLPATGFAASLGPIFDPRCPTTVEFAGGTELQGKAVLAYQFHSPANGCFGNLYGGFAYNAERTGRVLVDGPSWNVVRFEEQAFGFPKLFAFKSRHQVMSRDNVKIGDVVYWLPVSAEFIWTNKTPRRSRTLVEYRNHRHFESATEVQYK